MSEKVLLVDDEKDFLEVMSERLVSRGFEVDTSTSAEAAIQRIRDELYDAVIMDLRMPGTDGLEALKLIKEKKPEMQIILLTGHATIQKGVEAIKLGASDFMEKPADIEEITKKIKKAKEQKMLILDKMNQDRVIDAINKYGI